MTERGAAHILRSSSDPFRAGWTWCGKRHPALAIVGHSNRPICSRCEAAIAAVQIEGPIARVRLSRGLFATIDAADAELVREHTWRAAPDWRGSGCYAATNTLTETGRHTLRMHRLIMGAPPDLEVDHINHDGLDNRRSNLRLASSGQNQRNRRPDNEHQSSPFKGTSRQSASSWCAKIRLNGKQVRIGTFASAEEAARAYDQAAKQHYGEFACTNESLGLYDAALRAVPPVGRGR
jgi:hypothetical protein